MAATAATPARWNVRSRSSITSNVNARSRSSNTSSVNDRQRQEPQPQPKMMPRSRKQLTEQLRKQQEQLLQQQEKLRLQREHNSTVQMLLVEQLKEQRALQRIRDENMNTWMRNTNELLEEVLNWCMTPAEEEDEALVQPEEQEDEALVSWE